MRTWASILARLEEAPACVLVTVVAVEGSAPREVGARMVVDPDRRFHGTIGGGMLEYQAIEAAATDARTGRDGLRLERMSLGPDLGQCCGGRVTLALETFSRARQDEVIRFARLEAEGPFATRLHLAEGRSAGSRVVACDSDAAFGRSRVSLQDTVLEEQFGADPTPVWLFGAGHVGKALVLALAPLPFSVAWVDNRPDVFPAHVPVNVDVVAAADPVRVAADAPTGAEVLVMTHDHALDLAIADAALRRDAIAGVGMIGSATKAARMRSRLRAAGHEAARLDAVFRCPVGISGIASKQPSAIAVSVVAELMIRREQRVSVHRKRHHGLAGSVAAI
jgi:xanthine dehydrogenase accessory factor